LPELDRLAREIVDSKVDVIVAGGGLATRAAMRATSTIPIAMTSASDPVGTGLVASLSRPGGNVSGTSIVSWDLFAKRLELLKQMLPTCTRVAVLINRDNPAPANGWDNALESARTLGIALQRIDVTAIAEFEDAFETMRKGRAEALLVVQSNIFETHPFRFSSSP
jgi:putative ABC transport system substrate-binding protein